jgi:hypothetical protein
MTTWSCHLYSWLWRLLRELCLTECRIAFSRIPGHFQRRVSKYIGTPLTRIETASHPDMQKISIIGVLSKYRRHWQFESGKKMCTNGCFWLHIYILTNKTIFYSLLVTWCTNSLTFNNCTLCPHCIYVFRIYLRTNSDLCHLQHKLIGFYNRYDVFTALYGLGL